MVGWFDEVGDKVGYDFVYGRGEWALVVGEYHFVGLWCKWCLRDVYVRGR